MGMKMVDIMGEVKRGLEKARRIYLGEMIVPMNIVVYVIHEPMEWDKLVYRTCEEGRNVGFDYTLVHTEDCTKNHRYKLLMMLDDAIKYKCKYLLFIDSVGVVLGKPCWQICSTQEVISELKTLLEGQTLNC